MANKPTHTAYSVRDFQKQTGEANSSWSKIGVAFLHKDGKGLDVVLDALPVSGRIVLRINQPGPKQEADGCRKPLHGICGQPGCLQREPPNHRADAAPPNSPHSKWQAFEISLALVPWFVTDRRSRLRCGPIGNCKSSNSSTTGKGTCRG